MRAMISSDAITWNASLAEHPARSAAQRSFSAVAKGDLEEWLTVYAEESVVFDPVGPSMFDPEGKGHRGHEGLRAFWALAIEPIETFEFEINESFANGNVTASLGRIKTTFPDGSHTVTDLITVHEVDEDGRVVSMKAYWEPERTMATFTQPS
jgi:steroid Delta-isomerase